MEGSGFCVTAKPFKTRAQNAAYECNLELLPTLGVDVVVEQMDSLPV